MTAVKLTNQDLIDAIEEHCKKINKRATNLYKSRKSTLLAVIEANNISLEEVTSKKIVKDKVKDDVKKEKTDDYETEIIDGKITVKYVYDGKNETIKVGDEFKHKSDKCTVEKITPKFITFTNEFYNKQQKLSTKNCIESICYPRISDPNA